MLGPLVRRLLFAVFSAVGVLVIYLYFYLGFSKPVELAQDHRGPMYLLYKAHTGPYHEIVPVLNEIEQWARGRSISCNRTFGEFLDDPKAVDQDRLRSHAGCLLDSSLSQQAQNQDQLPAGYTYEERPARKYVVARFGGSPAIGPFKVYPKVKEFIEANRLQTNDTAVEIYKINGKKVETEYLFSLEN
jgi:AraC family transcriptional regulator